MSQPMDPKKAATRNFFSEWLEKLQQESWQLELLISGFVLFGLAQSYDYIINLINGFQKASLHGNVAGIVFISLMSLIYFWRIFFINLLIHVILRGLWIGTIGLRYVSGEIEFDNLNYSAPITNYLKRKIGSYDDYIEKLEKLSSLVFAYTFLLFFIFLSFVIFFIELIGFSELINYLKDKEIILSADIWGVIHGLGMLTLVFPAIFVFLDFITLGGLKRIKGGVFPKVYLFIYRIYSKLTFSFMYRPLLYNFIDDKFTRRFFLMSIPYFLLITVIYDGFSMNNYAFLPQMSRRFSTEQINPSYYDDLRQEMAGHSRALDRINNVEYISLPSTTVDGPYLEFFLRIYDFRDGEYLNKVKGIYDYRPAGIRHFLLRKKEVDSTLINEVYAKRDEELIKFFIEKKQAKSSEDTINWGSRQNAIERKWEQAERDYFKDKQSKVYNSLWALFNIQIDSVDYTDRCHRKYSFHPNNEERGFRCKIRIDSLEPGEHILHLTRKIYDDDAADSLDVVRISLPFYN